ncbi:MAG: putative molybdenum carrier protein [Desulfocapsaceae bacterium]|jgi:hypothetical protein|nr:putative molybdenum carrier protein [Desulfocapsaceae bacterium]
MALKKIISGGQTGADQGALDGARQCCFPYGGAIPAGRRTEAGALPEKYAMTELASDSYPLRTGQNVIDADGTLILSNGALSGGSLLTSRIAGERGKPCLHVNLEKDDFSSAVETVRRWVTANHLEVLNVAGPRASSDPRIYSLSRRLIVDLLSAGGHDHD